MSTSVKMDESTKSRLEELQAEIRLEAGVRVTQQELLARIVGEAYDSRAELIDSFRESEPDASVAEREAFHDGQIASGTTTRESDIDEELYG
ncbi:hypothetical protein [Haloparvum sedimenti]|uniref:hypothetical protein n=1 Tax=Haloparvum sedimenti TaxID=1678448 RepID=UPI00071E7A9E|nr:hypothetical protein [Haloparvum sedimenti]